jgi:hypothetical protein
MIRSPEAPREGLLLSYAARSHSVDLEGIIVGLATYVRLLECSLCLSSRSLSTYLYCTFNIFYIIYIHMYVHVLIYIIYISYIML